MNKTHTDCFYMRSLQEGIYKSIFILISSCKVINIIYTCLQQVAEVYNGFNKLMTNPQFCE